MNLTAFQEHIEHIGTTLDPNEDWIPALFLQKDNEMAIVGLLMGDDDETKNMCAKAMNILVRITNPDSACLITTAWVSKRMEKYKDLSPEELKKAFKLGLIPRPSEDPNRIEVISAFCMGVKGENDGQAFMFGYIERHPDKPPTISKWEVHDDEDLELSGRFAEAIQDGFASVDKTGDLSNLNKLKGTLDGSSYT